MINLSDVTIVSVNTRDPLYSVKAIEKSSKYIKFAEHLLITNQHINHEFIQCKIINTISSLSEYSKFCIKELHQYINTKFCLIVQPDGFVTNPLMWTNDFLNYDYIGAPWDVLLSQRALSHSLNIHIDDLSKVPIIVGNGGFSLRSKKLLQVCSELVYDDPNIPEDNFICLTNRETLKSKNIKFAPVSLACRFAIERPLDLNWKHVNLESYFGVHGYKHLPEKALLFNLLENYQDDLTSVKNALTF